MEEIHKLKEENKELRTPNALLEKELVCLREGKQPKLGGRGFRAHNHHCVPGVMTTWPFYPGVPALLRTHQVAGPGQQEYTHGSEEEVVGAGKELIDLTCAMKTIIFFNLNWIFCCVVNHPTVMLIVNGSWFDYIVCHSSCFEGMEGYWHLWKCWCPLMMVAGMLKGVELGRHRWHSPDIRIRDRIMALKENKSNTPSLRGTGWGVYCMVVDLM